MTEIDNGAAGAKDAIRFTVGETTLGKVLVAMSDKGVRAIAFGDEPEHWPASFGTNASRPIWPPTTPACGRPLPRS